MTTESPLTPKAQASRPLAVPHQPRNGIISPQLSLRALPTHAQTASDLTPVRAHYLKKSLVSLQFSRELEVLTNPSSQSSVSILSYLGLPFKPLPKDSGDPPDLLFSRFIFRQFCLTFPFLEGAPKDFFPQKLQPFVDSVIARNLSSGMESSEEAEGSTRLKTMDKLEKHLSLILGAAVKLVEKEEVVRLNQRDLDRLERIVKRRKEKAANLAEKFDVSVVGVRTVIERRHVRSRAHDEFIVRTRRPNQPDVYVSRRSGDFKTLAAELRKAHPEEEVRPPPQKDRSKVAAQSPVSPSAYTGMFPSIFGGSSASSQVNSQVNSSESLPLSPGSTNMSTITLNTPGKYNLSREKNRLTLRAYIHSLLNMPVIASSPVLRSFLMDGQIRLTQDEKTDIFRREEADRVREEGRQRFDKEIKDRVEKLSEAMTHVKSDVLGKDGLPQIFATIRSTSNVRDLPPDYLAVLEWGRISLASTIFQHFIASDSSSEYFSTLKRLHGMMPYFVLKGILKVSNPVGMIRGILDLFLAQPFGGKSLLQRMFTTSLTEEVKALQEDIEAVQDKVDDPVICEKVRQYVYAPKDFQAIYRFDAAQEKCNLLTVILRSGESPQLSRAQLQRVAKSSRAHAEYLKQRKNAEDSDSDEGPADESGWLFEDLAILLRMYARLRDREQLIALIFEGTTAELLKDIITIFYSPLAQVYKAASIADSVGDLQDFLNDLIKTVEQVEELSQENPGRTVQAFIDLVQRHEQAFYHFVHKVHSKGEGLFDGLMRWIELFLNFMREGLGEEFSLEYLLPHSGPDRSKILDEVDRVALYHYKLKVAHEEKIKRRFGRADAGSGAAAEDAAAQHLVDGVMNDLSFGELMQGDIADISDGESSEEESGEEDTTSGETETETEEETDEDDEVFVTPRSPPAVEGQSPFFNQPMSAPPTTVNHVNHPKVANDVPPPPPPKHDRSRSSSVPPAASKSHEKKLPPVPLGSGTHENAGHHHHGHPHSNAPRHQRTVDGLRTHHSVSSLSKPVPSPVSPPPVKLKSKKKTPLILKEPELQYIPEILPLFIEMIRPRLRTRAPTM